MPADDGKSHIESVKRYLVRALEKRNGGKLRDAENDYLDAALHLLMSAKSRPTGKRGRSMRQARDIISNMISVFYADEKRDTDSSRARGWEILRGLGITEPHGTSTSLEDIAGLADVKEEILERLIYPVKYRDLSRKYGVRPSGGILLYGPPGTGKTYMARAIASEAGAAFINVNPSKVYDQFFGQFEKNISKIFEAARLLSPAVVFFDEIESIAPSRGNAREDAVSRRGVSQMLIEMEGVEKSGDDEVFLLAATNRPWDVDGAILRPGRFDIQTYVPLPDEKARARIFQLNLRESAVSGSIDYNDLARLTQGYSGADISYICRRTASRTLARSVEKKREMSFDGSAIRETIGEVNPSVSGDTVETFRSWVSESGRK